MTNVIVSAPRRFVDRGRPTVSATIEIDGRRHEIYYRVSQGPLLEASDPFLAAALLPAMKLGAPLRVEGTVSPHTLRHVMRLQEMFSAIHPAFHCIPIEATAQPRPAGSAGRGSGCFFSGGVDSSHTVLKHKDEISHLIFVRGFDIRPDSQLLYNRIAGPIHQAAVELGKPLIEVETNLRELLDPYTDWALQAFGTALASVVHLLSPQFQSVYYAGGRHYAESRRGGINTVITLLWSIPDIEMIDDGRDVTRHQKVVQLAQSEQAMRWLRVCWENLGGEYNCGRCDKCTLTMISLSIAGALDKCQTFNRPLDLDAVRQLDLSDNDRRSFELLLAELEKSAPNPELAQAMRDCLGPSPAAASTAGEDVVPKAELRQAKRYIARLEANLDRIYTSRSWRWTTPLRQAADAARMLKEGRELWKR